MLNLHGLFFSSKRAERALNGTLAELNSYGVVSGRVYQDVNLNGRFDPGVDQPHANAKVRVDGSRYVVSDVNGNYRVDSIARGDHTVYLDLLSVRADLTLLDNTQQLITLDANRDLMVDSRVVRTGRISGLVWLDANNNGKLDGTEQSLPDVRVVTGSGRDTRAEIALLLNRRAFGYGNLTDERLLHDRRPATGRGSAISWIRSRCSGETNASRTSFASARLIRVSAA